MAQPGDCTGQALWICSAVAVYSVAAVVAVMVEEEVVVPAQGMVHRYLLALEEEAAEERMLSLIGERRKPEVRILSEYQDQKGAYGAHKHLHQ